MGRGDTLAKGDATTRPDAGAAAGLAVGMCAGAAGVDGVEATGAGAAGAEAAAAAGPAQTAQVTDAGSAPIHSTSSTAPCRHKSCGWMHQ